MSTLRETLGLVEPYDLVLVVVGLGLLGVATLLRRLRTRALSFPILALALGAAAMLVAPDGLPSLDPRSHPTLAVRVTELGVIVSLMGVGLKIDRAPSWRTWAVPWRLLGIAMPLTIAAAAWLGARVLGLPWATALLLGAVLAPTDPVLAADVQVGEPLDDGEGAAEERENELRFGLTTEAGLNDALAFPFTYAAIAIAATGPALDAWFTEWLAVDVVWRLGIGLAVGVAGGSLLARVLLRQGLDSERDRSLTGVGAIAGTLLLYGATEAVGGYGFLAVFVGSVTLRDQERDNQAHRSLHVVAEQVEQVLMTVILLAFGAAVASGLLSGLTWRGALVAVLAVVLVRPLAGWVSLAGTSRLDRVDRAIVSTYGIRGIGSLYYLAYAVADTAFVGEDTLWAVVGATIVLSVVLHGATASPLMAWRDRRAAVSTDA